MRTRHQDGWVEERGSRVKRWYGHYFIYVRDESGKESRRHVGVTLGDKAKLRKWEAQQALRKIIAAATGSQPRKDGAVTFDWFTQERFIPMHEGNWRPATKHGNLGDIRRYILPVLGTLPLKSIDKFHIASLLNRMAKVYSEPVVARTRVILSAILEEAVDMEYIDKNPARKVSMPECRSSKRPVLALSSLRRLLDAIVHPRDRLMLLIGTFCAVRTSEVLGLTWRSYQVDCLAIQNIAWEGKLYEGKTKTKKSRAPVYVPAEIRREIDAWRIATNPQSEEALLFPSRAGTPMTSRNFFQRRIHPIAKSLGIDPHLVTFQVLRRSCATRNQKRGSMKDVQEHLRHARIETTGNVYVQPVAESVKHMVEADVADVLGVPVEVDSENRRVN
jgi:integrase